MGDIGQGCADLARPGTAPTTTRWRAWITSAASACCTNECSRRDAKCVAPVPECFHHSGPRRCDVLFVFGASMDYDGEHVPHAPCDFLRRALRLRATCGATRRPARSTTRREDSWRWWDRPLGRLENPRRQRLRPQLVAGRPAAGPGRPRAKTGAWASASASGPAAWSPKTATSSTRSSRGEAPGTRRGMYKDPLRQPRSEHRGHDHDGRTRASTRARAPLAGPTRRRRPRRPSTRARGTWRASSTAAASGPAGRRAPSSATTPSSSRSSRPP